MIRNIYMYLGLLSFFIVQNVSADLSVRNNDFYKYIHTTHLPLDINFKKVDFYPQSISKFKEDVLLLDKTGNLYLIKDRFSIRRINHPPIENISKINLIKEGDNYVLPFHSVVVDSEYKNIYVSFEKYINHDVNHFAIASIGYDATHNKTIGNWKLVFESDHIYHRGKKISGVSAAGGKMYLSGENLYFSVGSFSTNSHLDETIDPQTLNAVKGKIYKFNLKTKNKEVFSIGHRNPQGMVITFDNIFYATEHGPEGGDELNIIKKDGNYGWPIKSFGTDYGFYSWIPPKKINNINFHNSRFIDPLFSWLPDIGISFVYQVRNFGKDWNKDLLIGGMRANSIFRLKILNGNVVYVEQIKVGKRIRDLTDINGKLFFITDEGFLGTITINKAKLLKDLIKKKWNV